jgi:hypothetical protein
MELLEQRQIADKLGSISLHQITEQVGANGGRRILHVLQDSPARVGVKSSKFSKKSGLLHKLHIFDGVRFE